MQLPKTKKCKRFYLLKVHKLLLPLNTVLGESPCKAKKRKDSGGQVASEKRSKLAKIDLESNC